MVGGGGGSRGGGGQGVVGVKGWWGSVMGVYRVGVKGWWGSRVVGVKGVVGVWG